eukprot:TRINITY_DN12271_c0_g1_i2.p1 TRINITY_DN12271_c0_g1~~TRINITY_DN12271_c0_g1_i2.p1  ORF type:complete len:399 (-),score=76.66 TRINITY_DN12271_c0_g1_i2:23-1192(-)
MLLDLLRWWLKHFGRASLQGVKEWRADPEWPLLLLAVTLFISFLVHWLGFRLETLTGQASNWEGRTGWRKPIVFGISNAMVACSLREAIRCQELLPRSCLAHLAAWSTAVEVTIITLQAWRGVPSHFNTETPLDAALYKVKLCGVGLLGVACVAAALGVLLRPTVAGAKAAALHHGMLQLCLSVAVGLVGLDWIGLEEAPGWPAVCVASGLGDHRKDEERLCRWATADASGSPCYEVHGYAVVKLAHFFPLHATEVLLLLSWVVQAPWQESSQPAPARGTTVVVCAAVGHWVMSILGVVQALRGDSLVLGLMRRHGLERPELKQDWASAAMLLAALDIAAAFVVAFTEPLRPEGPLGSKSDDSSRERHCIASIRTEQLLRLVSFRPKVQ